MEKVREGPPAAVTDRLNHLVSRVMTGGIYLSLLILALGLVWLLVAREVSLGGFAPTDLIRSGLFLLLITPTAAVMTCLIMFLKAKEWPNALLAAIVLAVLITSMVIA